MAYIYNFPPMMGEFDATDVVAKIHDELSEFQAEVGIYTFTESTKEFDRLNVKAVMELMDVIRACETMLRLFDNDYLVRAAHAEVLRKNDERGYCTKEKTSITARDFETDYEPDREAINQETNLFDRREAE